MKKILVFILVGTMILSVVAIAEENFDYNESQYNGVLYNIENDNVVLGNSIDDIDLLVSGDTIELSFVKSNERININALKSNSFYENNVEYSKFVGNATLKEFKYNVQLIISDNGLSGMIYNDNKEVITAFIVSKNNLSEFEYKLQEFNDYLKDSSLEENSIIKVSENQVLRSSYYNKSVYIYKDGLSIPFLLSGGTVEGTLHYIKAVNDPDGLKYSFDYIYGYVNAESGFDGLAIINEDEMYGVVWGTPSNPSSQITTWNVNYDAYYSSPYYFRATVSYTALVNSIPVLAWDSDKVLIN
jgi:hypothetical protein